MANSLLVKRNREIAEVREEQLLMEQRLDGVQARNHILLEETSVLDSNVFEQNGRAALLESQLAAVFLHQQAKEDELSKQRATHAATKSTLRSQLAERTDGMQRVRADLEARQQAISALNDEMAKLQAGLEAEDTTVDSLRRACAEPTAGAAQRQQALESAAARAVEEELQAVQSREDTQLEHASSARQRIHSLEAEIAAEHARRDDVSGSLRRVVVEQAEGTKRIRSCEAELAAHGGDVKSVLASLRGSLSEGASRSGSKAASDRVAQLRSELHASEDQCRALQQSLDVQKEQDATAAARLNAQLDEARGELQKSMQEVATAHNSQVVKLEQEIQAERRRFADEEGAQRMCLDQISQLKVSRVRAQTECGCAAVRSKAEAGRSAALGEELQRMQGEVSSAEGRLVAIQERLMQAEERKRDVQDAGRHRVAKLRGMLENLWQGLRAAKVGAAPRGFSPARSPVRSPLRSTMHSAHRVVD